MTRTPRVERRKRGRPKKEFATDPDRGTIEVAEVLWRIGFNRTEAYDLAAGIREGKLVSDDKLGFELPTSYDSRIETLRQKCERESTPGDSLRRSLLAARLIIANRASRQEQAVRMLDRLLTIAATSGVVKLRQAVAALAAQSGKRRQRRVARKTH